MFFAPIPEKGISDFIAHGSIIQVLTVRDKENYYKYRVNCVKILNQTSEFRSSIRNLKVVEALRCPSARVFALPFPRLPNGQEKREITENAFFLAASCTPMP